MGPVNWCAAAFVAALLLPVGTGLLQILREHRA
jgi:hypothetical protein